jgi:hypothetical protein
MIGSLGSSLRRFARTLDLSVLMLYKLYMSYRSRWLSVRSEAAPSGDEDAHG